MLEFVRAVATNADDDPARVRKPLTEAREELPHYRELVTSLCTR